MTEQSLFMVNQLLSTNELQQGFPFYDFKNDIIKIGCIFSIQFWLTSAPFPAQRAGEAKEA